MNRGREGRMDWSEVAGELSEKVRPDTRSKYFPKNPLRQYLIRRFLETLTDFLQHDQWETLLDVGCGEGFVDHYLGRRFPEISLTGVENDQQALEVARTINPSFRYLSGDALNLPFPDQSFDAVVCIEVLEHIIEYRKALAELSRVCSSLCVISVPAFPWYQGSNFLIGKNWSRLGEHPGHLVRFTRKKLASDMSDFFKDVRVGFSFPWLIAAAYSFQ